MSDREQPAAARGGATRSSGVKRPFRLTPGDPARQTRTGGTPRFPRLRPTGERGPSAPPPPPASARFPDAPPSVSAVPSRPTAPPAPSVPPKPTEPPKPATPPTGEAWLPGPAPTHAPTAAYDFTVAAPAQPDAYADTPGPHPLGPHPLGARTRTRSRMAAAVAAAVLGIGLIAGAALAGTGDGTKTAPQSAYTRASGLWHSVPVDQLFPPTVDGEGAGPGGADRTWTRIAVAPDTGCSNAFDPLLRQTLAPVGCLRLLRATYTDATSSHVLTVGLMFTKADTAAMRALGTRFRTEGLALRRDMMPRPYAAPGTVAAGFGDPQRASWTISVLTDAPVVVYAVSGFADARTVTEPQAAADAMKSGATTDIAQSGLGNEVRGLADRIERGLRKKADPPTEKP